MRRGTGISIEEAAEILGVNPKSVPRMVRRGLLSRAERWQKFGLEREDVERVALERFAHRDHPYWTDTAGAAELLGVTSARIRQLLRAERLPGVLHEGRWWVRRADVRSIANARESSRLS